MNRTFSPCMPFFQYECMTSRIPNHDWLSVCQTDGKLCHMRLKCEIITCKFRRIGMSYIDNILQCIVLWCVPCCFLLSESLSSLTHCHSLSTFFGYFMIEIGFSMLMHAQHFWHQNNTQLECIPQLDGIFVIYNQYIASHHLSICNDKVFTMLQFTECVCVFFFVECRCKMYRGKIIFATLFSSSVFFRVINFILLSRRK